MDPSLVGRTSDLEWLDAHAVAGAIATVTGPPGIGKTAVVRGWLASRGGGVWCPVERAHDVSGVFEALAAALGAPSAPASLARALGDRPRPVALDQVDGCLEAVGAALERLRVEAPAARWLVASQSPLGVPSERRRILGPLAPDDAAQLFRLRAARSGPEPQDVDAAVVRALVERVDHVPLAIELAAGWASVLTPREILDRIDELDGCPGLAPADGPHASMQAAVARAGERLDPRLREAVGRLTVFRGGWWLDAAEAVLAPVGSAMELSSLLCARSWLRSERVDAGIRFGMLRAVHRHAAGWLTAEQHADAVQRHTDHFLASNVEPLLYADPANLALAYRRAPDRRQAAHAGVRQVTHLLKQVAEVPGWLFEAVIEAATEAADPEAEAWARVLRNGSWIRRRLPGLPEDQRHVQWAATTADDPRLRAAALNQLALTTPDPERRIELWTRAVAAAESAPNSHEPAFLYHNIATVHAQCGRLAEARDWASRAFALARAAGRPQDNAMALVLLLTLAVRLDDLEAARAHRDELDALRIGGWRGAQLDAMAGLLALRQGSPEVAAERLASAEAWIRGPENEVVAGTHAAIVIARAVASVRARLPDAEPQVERMRTVAPPDHPLRARAERMWGSTSAVGEPPPDLEVYATVLDRLEPERVVVAERELRWLEVDGQRIELERRPVARRILRRLVDACSAGPASVEAAELLDAGWPGESILPDAAAGRLYTLLSSLRRLGLEGVLERFDGGYRLRGPVRIVAGP